MAFVIAVFKSVTSIAALLTVKLVMDANDPATNSLGVVATPLVSNVPTAAIVEEDTVVTAEASTATDVASLIVFKSAALLEASAVLMTIVNAFVSFTPALGWRNSVRSATLAFVAIVAVTVPVVSAASVFALAALIVRPLSTVMF